MNSKHEQTVNKKIQTSTRLHSFTNNELNLFQKKLSKSKNQPNTQISITTSLKDSIILTRNQTNSSLFDFKRNKFQSFISPTNRNNNNQSFIFNEKALKQQSSTNTYNVNLYSNKDNFEKNQSQKSLIGIRQKNFRTKSLVNNNNNSNKLLLNKETKKENPLENTLKIFQRLNTQLEKSQKSNNENSDPNSNSSNKQKSKKKKNLPELIYPDIDAIKSLNIEKLSEKQKSLILEEIIKNSNSRMKDYQNMLNYIMITLYDIKNIFQNKEESGGVNVNFNTKKAFIQPKTIEEEEFIEFTDFTTSPLKTDRLTSSKHSFKQISLNESYFNFNEDLMQENIQIEPIRASFIHNNPILPKYCKQKSKDDFKIKYSSSQNSPLKSKKSNNFVSKLVSYETKKFINKDHNVIM